MYCSHFGLHRPPFNNTPDPTFYFSTPEHEEALATLQYAVFQRKGFVLITGEVGAGKTLIGRMFLRQVDRSAAAAVISHTNLNGRQLLAAICGEFELETPPDATNLQLTERLQDFLLDQFAQDRFAVVLVDEAQNLPDESFEELRMLGNLEADDAKLLQICILGQPELRDRLRRSKLRQIDQRLFRRFHLPSLSRDNTRAYILHRLKVAGCARQDLFSPGAIDRIYAASQGIPRLINKICDNTLLTAYAASADQATEAMVDQSVENEMPPAGSESEKAVPAHAAAPDSAEPLAQHDPVTTVTASLGDSAAVDLSPADAQAYAISPAPARETTGSPEAARREQEIVPEQEILSLKKTTRETASQVRHVAAEAATTRKELQAAGQKVEQMWEDLRRRTEHYRRDIQSTLDDAVGKYQSLQRQMNELAATASSHEELEQIRRAHRQETDQVIADIARQGQEFKRLLHEAEQRWQQTRARLVNLGSNADAQAVIESLQADLDEKVGDLAARLDQHRQHIGRLAEVLQGHCDQTQTELHAIRDAQASQAQEAQARLAEARAAFEARLAEHEQRVALLDRRIDQRIAAVGDSVSQLEKRSPTGDDLDRVRREQAAAVGEMMNLLGRHGDELAAFRTDLERQTDTRSAQYVALIDAANTRIAAQSNHIEQLRQRLLDHLDETQQRFAEMNGQLQARDQAIRAERDAALADLQARNQAGLAERDAALADLRAEHQARAAEIQQRIEANRGTMKKLLGGVAERFRATRKQIDELGSAAASKNQLSDLQSQLQQESHSLLERLEGQKMAMEAQFDRVLWRLHETQGQLDSLSGSAARTDDIQQLQQQQADEREKVVAMLDTQRRNLESLAGAIHARCEALQASLAALPADIATVAQVDQVHGQVDQVRQQVDQVNGQVDQVRQQVDQVNGHVDQVRREHTDQFSHLLKELDTRRTELGQSIQSVAEYCDRTNATVNALAAEAATASEVEELRNDHGQQIGRIFQQMDQQAQTQTSHLQSLTSEVENHDERVAQLEEQAHKPVRLELAPTAGASLGMVVEAAHQQHGCLTEAVERAGAIAAHLHNASSQVQEVLQHWAGNADAVQVQSRQLQTSAETSVKILAAMKKCHAALDRKLNSQKWHDELARGEAVAQRLDKASAQAQAATSQLNAVLRDFDCCQESAEDMAARTRQTQQTVQQLTQQARQTVQQLSRILTEAASVSSKFDTSLNRRKQMLGAVAQNTARLMELIETARQADESTAKAASRKPEAKKIDKTNRVADVDWPTLRVRPAQVG